MGPRCRVDGLNEVAVTAQAIRPDDSAILRRDLDRLLEVLQGEGDGVPEAVVRLGRPLGKARRGQMALDASGRVPVPARFPIFSG